MIENNRNFKIFVDFEKMDNRAKEKCLKSFSDIVYIYFLTASKKNNEKIQMVDPETGEVYEVDKENYRYLYCDTFSKTQVAQELKIGRTTLYKKIDDLFTIGLIKKGMGWSKKKKKMVPVWIFPRFEAKNFINAETANFFTQIALYSNKEKQRKELHEKIIWLIFDLKRYWFAAEKDKTFTLSGLMNDLRFSDTKENRIKVFDYLILLQGLDIIQFDLTETEREGKIYRRFVLTYFNDSFNKKMKGYGDMLIGDKEMENFIEEQKRICDFSEGVF